MNDHLATKDDLKEVRNDLKEVRDELHETKRELKEEILGVRKELKEEIQEVRKELTEVKEQVAINTFDLRELKSEVGELRTEMNEKFDTVLTAIDGLAGLITNGQVEKAATESALKRHEGILESHEERIDKLEKNAA